jgi:hypothetical protein
MFPLQGDGEMQGLSRSGAPGAAEGKNLHVLLSAREREVPELPGYGRLRRFGEAGFAGSGRIQRIRGSMNPSAEMKYNPFLWSDGCCS